MKQKTKLILIAVVVIILAMTILACIFRPIEVVGISMENSYSNGDIVWINKLNKKIGYDDIVVAKNEGGKIIKRVVGFKGDTIEIIDNQLYRNGQLIISFGEHVWNNNQYCQLQDGEYYLLGDNYNNSIDSRTFGAVNIKEIIGVVI